MRYLAPVAVFLLCVSASGCVLHIGSFGSKAARAWTEASESFTVDASELREVQATSHNGPVRAVGAAEREQVRVVADKRVGGGDPDDARRALDALEIEREVRDGTLELGWRWTESRGKRWHAIVAFHVEMPAGLELDVTTHNGPVRVTDVDGAVRVETHNGTVGVEGAPRSLDVTTHNGATRADLRRARSIDGRIETHNGAVTILVGEEASARVDCETHRGGVSVGGPVTRRSGGRYDVRATLGDGNGRLSVETHNGHIKIGS